MLRRFALLLVSQGLPCCRNAAENRYFLRIGSGPECRSLQHSGPGQYSV